jgi:hypothetical protein
MINTSSPSLIFLHSLREKSENLPMLQTQNLTDISDKNIYSMVMSPDQPNLGFQLKLIRSAPTYNSPEQMWQFVSEFSVRDYSGTYYVKLIPCTVTQVNA